MSDDMPPGNGFDRTETTQERILLGVATAKDEWFRQGAKYLVAIVVALGGVGTLVGVGMYAAGRASAADLQATDGRVIKVEQAHIDLEKRFDSIDVKVDKIGENLYRMALRSGVPRTEMTPPPPPTIKPAPPAGEHR